MENEKPNTAEDIIIFRDVHKWFGEFHVLQDINLTVQKKERIVICGPSGSGKSTLIRCINRLVEPSSGDVVLNGKNITKMGRSDLRAARRSMGMIFQEFNLVERLSVMENVLSGRLGYVSPWRAWLRKYPQEDIDRAFELLESIGLIDFFRQRADSLSGGQRQRVGIARAVAMEPKLMLFDEVTSALDPEMI